MFTMAQNNQRQQGGELANTNNNNTYYYNAVGPFGDTTYTKIFVGGLAWETQRDTMRRYFEQFGEIQEAVVITDRATRKSKGYGFVTFRDPESAARACVNPSPVIDGRRANCNLAYLGAAQRSIRPPTPQPAGGGSWFRGGAPPYQSQGTSSYTQQQTQYAFPQPLPYQSIGYSGYTQEGMYPLTYYNPYGSHQYYGVLHNPASIYQYYSQYPNYGTGIQYSQFLQHNSLLQQQQQLQQYYGQVISIPLTTTTSNTTTNLPQSNNTASTLTTKTTGMSVAEAAEFSTAGGDKVEGNSS